MFIENKFEALKVIGTKTYYRRNGEEELVFKNERISLEIYSCFEILDIVVGVDGVRRNYKDSFLLTADEKACINDILKSKVGVDVKCASLEDALSKILIKDGRFNYELINEEAAEKMSREDRVATKKALIKSMKSHNTELIVRAAVGTAVIVAAGIFIFINSLVSNDYSEFEILARRVISVVMLIALPFLWNFLFIPPIKKNAVNIKENEIELEVLIGDLAEYDKQENT